MSDKKQNNDPINNETQEAEKAGLLYEDVPPEVYEDDDQIRVSDLLDIIWAGKIKIAIITFFLFCFAIFHYVSAPKEYVANSRFLPERQVQQFQFDRMFAFGDLARGMNIGGGVADGSLPSYFYLDIIRSVEFQRDLLDREVDLYNDGRTVTLFEYFTGIYEQPYRNRVYSTIKRNTIGLPMRFFVFVTSIFTRAEEKNEEIRVKSDEIVVDGSLSTPQHVINRERFYLLSPQFESASSSLSNRISFNYGTLTFEVRTTMPDPMAAVQLNAYVVDMVQEYLINYRIQKARDNLQYIEVLYEEAEERYEQAHRELALYLDSNQGFLTAVAELEKERLQQRSNLAYSLYTSVATRVEEARTRLKEDTPIYTTFQDPTFPTNPSGGNIMILPASIFIGIFLGVLWTFAEKFFLLIGRVLGILRE